MGAGFLQVRNINRLTSGDDSMMNFMPVIVCSLLGVLSGIIGVGSFLVYLFK